jgi:serine/threonine protein kinase/Flp pilus assembly protein TadD
MLDNSHHVADPESLTEDLSAALPSVPGYRTVHLIGHGGMGRVYLAQDLTLGRLVAIKILLEHMSRDPGIKARFLHEARAMASVEHPNIVRVYAFGEEDPATFLVMEYVDGESLETRIAREAPMAESQALQLVRDVIHALDAAWRKQLVHRDVKPSNILIDRGSRVRLTDFGLARSVTAELPTGADRDAIQGTALYMSPEQAMGEAVTDFRCDIYSLGIVLFEMLTATRPFRGPNPAAIVRQHLSAPLPPPQSLRPELSAGVADLCRWMTAKEPASRPESYGQLDARIGQLLAQIDPVGLVRSSPHSIAVLPMCDLSRDGDQDHFCEGLSEEIINALARVRDLSVASRTSAFRFKGASSDIREIGRRLSVNTVLEGSVRTVGDRLRVTAQLVDVATGFHIWSERYDRKLHDVFAVQDDITARIVDALKISLTSQELVAIRGTHAHNVQAFDFYLRGRKYFWEQTGPSLKIARNMLQRAIDIEPDYALGHSALADSCSFLYMYVDSRSEYLDEANRASLRALEIDPELPEAHISRGLALDLAGRHEESVQQFDVAIVANPNSFDAYYLYGRACIPHGEPEKAARLFERAHEVRPDSYLAPQMLRMVYERLGRHGEAAAIAHRTLALVERTLEVAPDDARALYTGAQNAVLIGKKDLGLCWTRHLLATNPDDPAVLYNAACVYSLAREVDEAIAVLRKAVECGFAHRAWAEHDTDLDPLRSHPGFERILDSIG